MKLITKALDLNAGRALPRALVFIYVNWAIQAQQSEIACRDLLAALKSDHPDEVIPAYRVDLSEQQGEVWDGIRNWLKEEGKPFGRLTYGGYGAMLWVRSGTVAAYVPYLATVECNKLRAMTRGVFGLDAVAG